MNDRTSMQVPAQVKEIAEKSVEQVEKAFDAFIQAAHKSAEMVPPPGAVFSKKTISMTEQNMKAGFEHARNLLHATDLEHFMRLQNEFLKAQFTTAQEQMKQMNDDVMASVKTATPHEIK